MPPDHSTPSEPVSRTPRDQEADLNEIIKNLMSERYIEWPNEAGFDGLKEEKGPIQINVTGTIPSWAAGSLYRTGPGQFQVEDTAKGSYNISHWFDGLAHTHRFDIVAPVSTSKDGEDQSKPEDASGARVFYSSRRQSEALERQIQENGRHLMYSFGQRSDPCIGLFGKFMAAWYAAFPPPGRPSAENICVTVQPNHPGFDSSSSPSITADTAPKAVPSHGHRAGIPPSVWLASDTSSYRQVDPSTLEPIGTANQTVLHPDLKGQLSCAHAQRDPKTGDVYNFNQEFGRETIYRIFRVSANTGKTDIIATVQRPNLSPAYIHSFYLSPSFVVLCVPSSHLAWYGIKVAWERNLLDAIKPFDPAASCKWFVVDRLHGRGVVAEFDTPAGFFFHTVNAFEEADDHDAADATVSLFCEVVQYATTDVLHALYHETLTQKNGAARRYWSNERRARASNVDLVRYRVRIPVVKKNNDNNNNNNTTTKINSNGTRPRTTTIAHPTPETIFSIPGPHAGELPTMNPAYATRRHRYVYGVASRGLSTLSDALAKTDVDTGAALLWAGPHGHTPGEAIFVGRPGASDEDEDDGVLLSVVLDGTAASSYLLCLDARTMRELGRAEVGFAVGFGFHGAHVMV